ncbi:HEAT repeat domain-containing protein [Polyangium aurulentum]|uniref:HEAT repeat domain-containing protein n=1 Tax=Polyangium aurulentum TaxID=2567896 RepID=UPI00146B54A8|nr:HEAT repeat domain-containing protein [Polyangium aurulentum]UQA63122.1 HEAT repeat domain-containing protein [Polyangium aurulentum]
MSRRTAYLRSLLTRHEVVLLPLAGGEEGRRDANVPLPAVFQPLALRAAGARPREERASDEAQDDDGDAPFDDDYYWDPDDLSRSDRAARTLIVDGGEEALARTPAHRMVVLGGPGTGKTTLLRALVSRAARRALEDPSAPLPISVDLPDLAEHGTDLRKYLTRLLASLGQPEETADLLATALDEGTSLVCLDGLDEVAPARRGGVLAWLASLGNDRGAWVVGSRFTQYRSGDLGAGVFTEWELCPLDDSAQRRLGERLLRRLAPPGAPPAASDVDRFLDALARHPQAEAWKGVPLLFSLTASAWAQRGALPESRASLYRLAVEALLASRTPDVAARSALREAVARVSLELFRRGGRTFPREALREAIEGLPAHARATLAGPQQLEHQVRGSGLLESAGEAYRFGHQTLHEYLVAAALAGDLVAGGEAAQRAWDLAWAKRSFSRWSEPLRLMVGVLVHELGDAGAQKALAWLGALAAQRDSAQGDPGDLALGLAVRSLAEVGAPPASWPEQDLAPIEALLDAWTERALDRRHRNDAASTLVEALAAEVARLGLPVRQRVIEPLARALTSDPDARRREAAANALVKLGAEAPLDALVKALGDASPSVRQIAATALSAFGDRCPPEPLVAAMRGADEWTLGTLSATIALLGDRAPIDELISMLRDDHADLRVAAVEALARLGDRVPLATFVEATRDRDWRVRDRAVRALGRLGDRTARDEGAVEAILTQLTRGDRIGMRMSALWALRELGDRLPPERWVEPTLAMLDDEDSGGSTDAALLLATLGERAPFEELAKRLDGKGAKSAEAAARALIALGQWVPIDLLTARLKAKTNGPQMLALRVLGGTGERAPVDRMVAKLDAKSPDVRAAAARALGKLGERAPVEALVGATKDKNAKVRTEALVALARLGDRAPVEVLVKGVRKLDLFAQQAVVAGIVRAGGKLTREELLAIARECETAEGQDMLVTADRLAAAASRCIDASTLVALMRDPDDGVSGLSMELLRKKIARGEAEDAIAALIHMVEHPEAENPAPAAQPSADEEDDEDELYDDDDDEDEDEDDLPSQPLHELAASLLGELGAKAPDAWLRHRIDKVQAKVRTGLRATAVHIAAAAGEVACVPHILELVLSDDTDLQELAIEVASTMLAQPSLAPESRASLLAALVSLLTHPRPMARQEAAWSLRRARPEEAEAIAALWKVVTRESTGNVQSDRLSALQALREIGAPPDVDVLVKLLGDDSVGDTAATWLGALGEAAPVGAVVEKLERALGALGKDVLSSKNGDTAAHAVQALGSLGERAPVAPLLQALECSSMKAREAASLALPKLGARVPLEPLITLLASGERHLRPLAATALRGRCEPEAVRALEAALRDPDLDVRQHAAWALDEVGARDPELLPVEALLAAAREARPKSPRDWRGDEGARGAAARALRRLGARAPREALEALADTEDRHVRLQAMLALASLGPNLPVQFFEKHLGDHDQKVREAAAGVLASLGDRVPAEVFLARVETLDEDALPAVAKRIASERSEAARNALRRWLSQGSSTARSRVAEELTSLPPGCLDDLVDEMRALALDRWWRLRSAGLSMLAAHAPETFTSLGRDAARLLAGGPPEGALGDVALQEELAALGSLPRWPKEAWDRVFEAIASPLPPLRALAASTLAGRTPVPDRALRALWSLRSDPAGVVREAVDRALARILSREGGLEDDEA